jgi:hypothetical protein
VAQLWHARANLTINNKHVVTGLIIACGLSSLDPDAIYYFNDLSDYTEGRDYLSTDSASHSETLTIVGMPESARQGLFR